MKRVLNFLAKFQNKQKILRAGIVTLLIFAALFLFLFDTGDQNEKEMMPQSETDTQLTEQTDTSTEAIIVDVSGEVVNPSVIELPAGSRINDAITAAGGLTDSADISGINRAAMLSDGEKVFIPSKQSTPANGGTVPNGGGNTANGQININRASAAELQEVPGIGPATADKIIQYRTDNGLFRKLDELMKVSGIGDKTFAKMKPYICI